MSAALTTEYLTRCAENEGARAILAVNGYANADTAAYFAREAAHYAGLLLAAGQAYGTLRVTQ